MVLLNLKGGLKGFPTGITDDPIMALVLGQTDSHPNAEERRLIYVAITRARCGAFLLAARNPLSEFTQELQGPNYASWIEIQAVPSMSEFGPCPSCKDGRLTLKAGGFYGCSNYPHCTETLNAAPELREEVGNRATPGPGKRAKQRPEVRSLKQLTASPRPVPRPPTPKGIPSPIRSSIPVASSQPRIDGAGTRGASERGGSKPSNANAVITTPRYVQPVSRIPNVDKNYDPDPDLPRFSTCPVCGGDGGVNGTCYRCHGRGYMD